jgi:hypothetical protein
VKRKKMMKLSTGKGIILLSIIAVAAVLSGLYVTAYATGNSENYKLPELAGANFGQGVGGRMRCGGGLGGFVEISSAYNQTVMSIAESDSDVQNLIADGYSVSSVRPIIKSVVEADGSVVTKASTAVVMLEEDTTGRAFVYVDVTVGKVTRIEIITRTIIEKN